MGSPIPTLFHLADTLGEKYFYYPHFTMRKLRVREISLIDPSSLFHLNS